MVNKIFKNEVYKELENSSEADEWGNKYYSDILYTNNQETENILYYIGSMGRRWNRVLRQHPAIQSGDFENSAKNEFASDGEQLSRIKKLFALINNHKIPENIILYRYTRKEDFKHFFLSRNFKKGTTYTDKAFISTTLVKDSLKDFQKRYDSNCILKLYVPKGLNGAYLSLKNPLVTLNEQEIVLLPGTKFEIIKIHYFTSPMLIECKALLPEK